MSNLREICILTINSIIMTSDFDICQSSYAKKLEIMSKLLCVILEAIGWAVLKRKGLRDPPHSQEAKKKSPAEQSFLK